MTWIHAIFQAVKVVGALVLGYVALVGLGIGGYAIAVKLGWDRRK